VTPAAVLFAASLGLAATMGVEFIPRLEEGDLAIQVWRLPSVSLSESVATSLEIERVLRRFPEVDRVVTRTGSPAVATDVMGIEMSDVFVILKPRRQWITAHCRETLIAGMKAALDGEVPGIGLGFTQPIEMRFNELIAGSRSDLAIKIFGEDLDLLTQTAERVAVALERVPGAADVKVEQIAGLPLLRVVVDREQIARYGLTAADVLAFVEVARVGHVVGTVLQGTRRFDLVVRLAEAATADPASLGDLLLPTPHGELVPLSRVAAIRLDAGPAQVSRQNVARRILVECNIRGADLGGFVAQAQRMVRRTVTLPPGYYIEWGGQYEHLREAARRLALVVPVTLMLILGLLSVAFGGRRPALLIFLNVPLALSGGVLALWLRGLPLSISAAIGFIALFGIAVLNGVVLVSHIRNLEASGLPTDLAVVRGAQDRLRPVLMTAMVASLGFLPMALATSLGAELQRPLATVVIGGLLTSTALTLLVVPPCYDWAERRTRERAGMDSPACGRECPPGGLPRPPSPSGPDDGIVESDRAEGQVRVEDVSAHRPSSSNAVAGQGLARSCRGLSDAAL
jgi:cobalt-zinc-cadmium resistance protein CzcA